MVGNTVSHYKILERLGGGGMGVVYKADDTKLKRTVALKFLPPELTRDPEAKERFIHEAQAASALQHSNICVVHDIDETADGQMFIVMEYYQGETLKEKIEHGTLGIEAAVDIALQVAGGLARAHEQGITHRDIKPANVIVSADGVARILDFGLAKLTGQTRLTRAGSTLGTAAYMSPEQAQGELVDRRTDLWSLGVVLYEMITGQLPFRGEHESALVYAILNLDPPPMGSLRTGVPPALEEIVHKALAKDAAERYQHADEIVADLRRLKHESQQSTAPHGGQPPPVKRLKKRRRTLLISSAALLILVAGLLVLKPFLSEDLLVSEPKPIAVITFVNQTGDPAYDYLEEAIPSLLITSLEQSRYLRVTTWERMHDLLEQLGKRNVRTIDKDLGFDLCQRDGIDAIALGTFTKAGNMFATEVKVLDVHTKRLLKSASARGEGIESILKSQIDDLSREISRGVGLSERSIETTQPSLADRTTSSMDAYNYYLRGKAEYAGYSFSTARQFLQRAIGVDSTFALAYLWLGVSNVQLGDFVEARQALQKAKLYGKRATIKEQLYTDGAYAGFVDHDWEGSKLTIQKCIELFPQEKEAYLLLSTVGRRTGFTPEQSIQCLRKALELDPAYPEALNQIAYSYAGLGNFEEALKYLRRYASAQPGDPNPFDSMGEILFKMGRLDESIAKYEEALSVKPDFESAKSALSYVYGLREDFAKAERHSRELLVMTKSQTQQASYLCQAATIHYCMGRIREALHDLQQGAEIAQAARNTEILAITYWLRGCFCFDRRTVADCAKHFRAWYDLEAREKPSQAATTALRYGLVMGLLDLQKGRLDSAKTRLERVERVLPELIPADKSYGDSYRSILSAEILLAMDSTYAATFAVREAGFLRIPNMSTVNITYYNVPIGRDYLGGFYARAGLLDSAIIAYRHATTFDSSDADRRVILPIYHYRLALLYEQKGLKGEASQQYQRFLDLWKEADKDLPELLDARKRLARLSGRQTSA